MDVKRPYPSYGSFGGGSRFELYNIVINKLDEKHKDLKAIRFFTSDLPSGGCLYERSDDEDVPLGKPLLLSGPQLPLHTYPPIDILFGNPDWGFNVRYNRFRFGEWRYNWPSRRELKNGETSLYIDYEIISFSVAAQLEFEFVFEGDEEPTIEITKGYISAETKGRPNTLRALQSFGKRSKRKITSSCPQIELKRSNLALHFDGELDVEVKLRFSLSKKLKTEVSGKIVGINTFKAQSSSKEDIKFYYADVGDLKLKLKLTWFDDLAWFS